jgi:gluconolactonase
MDRRLFLTATAASATAAVANAAAGIAATVPPTSETGVPLHATGDLQMPLGPLPGSRYPDPHIEVIDKARFKGSPGTGGVERVATGFRWAEGPAYFRGGRYLVWSDIPNNRMMRLLEDDNHLSVFRSPSNNSNGNTTDRDGRLVTCEHGGRRVTRTEHDGTITIIADRYNGKRFNSPNDLVVASDGSIWFTDPSYGILGNYEGIKSEQEQPGHYVYRVDAQSGNIAIVADDFKQPNGLCFSHDEKRLYIIDSEAQTIRVFDVDVGSGKLTNGKQFAEKVATDGIRVDIEGNVWFSIGWGDPKEDGVHCYSPGGEILGKIHIPETVANLVFGGLLRNRLYICASTSLYACYVNTQGAALP